MKEEVIEWGLYYPLMSRLDISHAWSKDGKLMKIVRSGSLEELWCGVREHYAAALNCILKQDYEKCREELSKFKVIPIEAKTLKGFREQLKTASKVLTIWKVGKFKLREAKDVLHQIERIKSKDLVFEKDKVVLKVDNREMAEYYIVEDL